MPRVTLDQVRALGDFTQGFRWTLNIIKAPDAVPGFPASEQLDLRCESVDLPTKPNQSVEVTIKGQTVYQPGISRPNGQISLQFVETVDNVIATWLTNWRKAVWPNNTGARVTKKELEAVFQIIRLNNADEGIWQYTLKGVLPVQNSPGQLSSTSADPLKPQLNISFDDFDEGPVA